MRRLTFMIVLTSFGCTPKALDLGETLSGGTDTTGDTDATATATAGETGAPVCEPPQWFECPGTDLCEVLDCDNELGRIDESGCERASCTSTQDCAAGERCIEIMVAGFCESSGISCEMQSGQCACGGSDDCTMGSRCVDEAVAIANDCPIEGADCSGLVGWSDNLQFAYVNRLSWGHKELAASASSCAVKVEEKILADANLCDLNLCWEVCRLHPCAGYEQTCQATCEQAAADISEEQLRAIVMNAAATPGLCTCDLCETDSFGFCEVMWDCQQG